MDLGALLAALQSHGPALSSLPATTLLKFVRTLPRLKSIIDLHEDTVTSRRRDNRARGTCPVRLPDDTLKFLAQSLDLDHATVLSLWDATRTLVWSMPEEEEEGEEIFEAYMRYGQDYQTSYTDLFPPNKLCTNQSCSYVRTQQSRELAEPSRYEATLYTRARGPVPVYTTSLYCRGCHTRYHHNYAVVRGEEPNTYLRQYYGGLPDIVEVAEHVFMEKEVIVSFKSMAVFSAVSATSFVRIFMTSHQAPDVPDWPTSLTLRAEVVWDAFCLLSILQHYDEQGWLLELPHSGVSSQYERLSGVMAARNKFMVGHGQQHWSHVCSVCRKVTMNEEGVPMKTDAVVCDGIGVGRFCCWVHDCQEPLPTKRELYCLPHSYMHLRCAVEGCLYQRVAPHRTCPLPAHRAEEEAFSERATAMFQLRARLQRLGLSAPVDASGQHDADLLAGDVMEEDESCSQKPETGVRKLRTRFGRRRTHNEQLVVRPCGVILARATFYGSEAISDVVNFWKAVFPTPQSIPEFIFFDNNCQVVRHLQAAPVDHYFDQCGLPVDVFHFKSKHKEKDAPCNAACNPWGFDELHDGSRWTFNSSVAEQTNVWFGSFAAIAREMNPVRYDFFLDEMIKEKNRFTVAELEKKGAQPWNVDCGYLLGTSSSMSQTDY